MSAITTHQPFSYRKVKKVRVTSANMTFQLMRVPWPLGKRARIVSLTVDNFNGVAGSAHIFDSDESSSTPPKSGSAGAALITVGAAASAASGVSASSTVRGEGDLPREIFRGGLAVQFTQINAQISAEIEIW